MQNILIHYLMLYLPEGNKDNEKNRFIIGSISRQIKFVFFTFIINTFICYFIVKE